MSASSTILNEIQAQIVKFGKIENLKKFYNSHPECGQLPEGVFSRNRQMTFSDLINFLLYPRSKSTDLELLEYSHLIGKSNVNKSDFSRRRQYVPAACLKELSKSAVAAVSRNCQVRTWNGHLLLAGDGTTYSLPNTPAIRLEYLQGRKTGIGEQALARGVFLKDVLNDIGISSNMECYGRDEISLLCDEFESLPSEIMRLMPIVLLDRKFCAYTLLAKLIQLNIGFVIRVKSRFNRAVDEFINSGKSEAQVDLHPAPTTLKKLNRLYGKSDYTTFRVRLVRLSADVVVMTSLDCNLFSGTHEDIYHARWDDETTIGFLKNCLQVEIFSGLSDNALQQDFHAKTILYNLLSALCQQAALLRHDDGDRRINRNLALGILKLNAILALTGTDKVRNTNLHSVLNELARFTIPVKKFRSNPRLFRKIKHSGKYITLYNYRRAI